MTWAITLRKIGANGESGMTEVTVEDIDAIIELVDGLKENAEDKFEEVPASIAEMIGATMGYLRCLRTRVRKAEEERKEK